VPSAWSTTAGNVVTNGTLTTFGTFTIATFAFGAVAAILFMRLVSRNAYVPGGMIAVPEPRVAGPSTSFEPYSTEIKVGASARA
jgi:hypothetical protein